MESAAGGAYTWISVRRNDSVMDRRSFIAAVAAGIVAAPLAASAQTATNVRRIGFLTSGARPTPAELHEESAPLRELGWVEEKNLLIERRYTNGRAELLQRFAEERSAESRAHRHLRHQRNIGGQECECGDTDRY